MNTHVFLSYNRADEHACALLCTALEQAGLTVFRDQDQIRASDRWVTELERALDDCVAFIVLVGREGIVRWVGAEVQVALNRRFSSRDEERRLEIFPVLIDRINPETLPPFLRILQCTQWSPSEPPPQVLVDAVKGRALPPFERHSFDGCPFLGLQAFQRKDAPLFFGRQKETLEALAGLGDQGGGNPTAVQEGTGAAYYRWLQIEGNSGAGKSSLVHAGLLPLVGNGALWARTGFEHWHVIGPMLPSEDPVYRLAEALEHSLGPGHRDVQERCRRLSENAEGLKHDLSDSKQAGTAYLLVIDQFEELFTFSKKAAREQFLRLLATALQDRDCPLFVISTIRVDFLEDVGNSAALGAIYNGCCKRYLLPTISEAGLREAIEQPALLAGLDVSQVIAAILRDARDEVGALPLVENTLVTLWNDPGRRGGPLSGKYYLEQNGVAGMLSSQADALLDRVEAEFPRKGKRAALELLLRLTRLSDQGRHTRKRILLDEAVEVAGDGDAEMGHRVIELLSGARSKDRPGDAHRYTLRLITTHVENRGSTFATSTTRKRATYVDLIHETLIRTSGGDDAGKGRPYWPTLYEFVVANRDRDIYRQQLEIQTDQWLASAWFNRWWGLAGWRELRRYRKLRIPKQSDQGRFLFFSRWALRAQVVSLILLVGYIMQSYLWTVTNGLPLESIVTLQRFRFGYAPTPTMIGIKPGSFWMGNNNKAAVEADQYNVMQDFGIASAHVDIGKGFSLGKYEVTYDEFDYYVWAQRRAGHPEVRFPATAKGGRGMQPVANVSWTEATGFTDWLSQHKGMRCRLPTEAEWEYAARAGTDTRYPWGNDIDKDKANCIDCGSQWDNEQPAPVGSFAKNAFGLYDTSGNVWEWTCSAWSKTFDGSAQTCKSESGSRVVRGGSWGYDPGFATSAARLNRYTKIRSNNIGFRALCSSAAE